MTSRTTTALLLAAVFLLGTVGGFLLPVVPMVALALLVTGSVAAGAVVVLT